MGKINDYFNYRIKYLKMKKKKGELYLEGPSISEGYINDSSATKKVFIRLEKTEVIKLEI